MCVAETLFGGEGYEELKYQ